MTKCFYCQKMKMKNINYLCNIECKFCKNIVCIRHMDIKIHECTGEIDKTLSLPNKVHPEKVDKI